MGINDNIKIRRKNLYKLANEIQYYALSNNKARNIVGEINKQI